MQSISFIGSHLLALAFATGLFSLLIYGIGSTKGEGRLVASAQRALGAAFFLITASVVVLVGAFLTNDYTLLYVYNYSSNTLPLFYKLTGLWAGLDGSILFWTWLVSLYAVVVFYQNRKKNADWMPWINAVMMVIVLFFLSLMIFANNPFSPLGFAATDGKGLNPLLQNIAMVVHPPALYLGFTGFSVPFAFVIAALISRRCDSSWIEDTRRWVIVAWFFLTLGLILGGAWAYVELGWGGFWAWDPVENAALMPWFLATAYLHSVITQKKRDMLKVWNVSLVVLTFLMTIVGTYLTRSGIVESVHAFSASNLGPFFLVFLAFVFLFSFCLILSRLSFLKSGNVLHSYFSKEASFIFNNVALLVACFAVLWGTLFPTISEWITGERISVGPPFFNQMMAPIGLVLLLLMGIGPMISWRRASAQNLKSGLLGPAIFGVIVLMGSFVSGIRQWYALGTFSLVSFVLAVLYLEFSRGIRVVKKQKGFGFLASLVDLFIHNNRRYGSYVVHMGVLLIFMGIAGAVFKTEADFSLVPGESYEFEGFRFVYQKPNIAETEHKTSLSAFVSVYEGGKKISELVPSKYFYHTSGQPTTEVDLYQTPLKDVYLIIGGLEPKTLRADFRVTINPLVSFVWLGGFVILLGVMILLFPRMLHPPPKGQTSLLVSLLFLMSMVFFCASSFAEEQNHTQENDPSADHRDPFVFLDRKDPQFHHVQDLSSRLLCQCGGCVRTSLKACTCTFAKEERNFIWSLMQKDRSDNDIIQSFVKKYGLAVLTTPPREGFFNMAYLFPIVILTGGIMVGFLVTYRWARGGAQKKPVIADSFYVKKISEALKEWKGD